MKFSRTGASEALESLAWHFNFFVGKTLSINEIAASTGLAWATVRKFAGAIEELHLVLPYVSLSASGVEVRSSSAGLASASPDRMSLAALYLLTHTQSAGSSSRGLMVRDHQAFMKVYKAEVGDLVALGLASATGGTMRLTSAGMSLAARVLEQIKSSESADDLATPERDEEAPLVKIGWYETPRGTVLQRCYVESEGPIYPILVEPSPHAIS